MRVTSSMYNKNIYEQSNSLLRNKLFDVNKQIASGLKIQYAKDDVITFANTMRLDNEITTLAQTKKSTQSGYVLANQSDTVLNEFNDSINKVRKLLIKAANGTNSDTSLDALASELRVLEKHLKNLANTSIKGQYLFAGSATDIKPISADGTYNGNDKALHSFTGYSTKEQHNITGAELFLGEEKVVKRKITTNVLLSNLSKKYNYQTKEDNGSVPTPITPEDTIRDLMGDTNSDIDTAKEKHHFYIRGTKSNGDTFKEHLKMRDDETIDSLLTKIGDAFGNTPDLKLVNVSLDNNGNIVIDDKMKGSSKLNFHMVGASDFKDGGNPGDTGDVNNIDDLDDGETDFVKLLKNTTTAGNRNLYVKEFIKSGLKSGNTATNIVATNIEGIVHDRTQFGVNGAKVFSNVAQIINSTNEFAQPSTKLSEVSVNSSLDGKVMKLTGKDKDGNDLDVDIKLSSAGSTFEIGGKKYNIYNADTPRGLVDADKMTYQQLMDVMNMVTTGNLPASDPGTVSEYDDAISEANRAARTHLSYDGKIQFEEIHKTSTQARIALYDSNSGDFTADPSVMTFNNNDALTIRDPKTDFFKELDEMITSVENHKTWPDSSTGDKRNVGIENSIAMLDDLQDHFARSHSKIGAQSTAFKISIKKTDLLKLSIATLRSSTIDVDLAEAALTLNNLNINYNAMLATAGKVSKLSLVNYL